MKRILSLILTAVIVLPMCLMSGCGTKSVATKPTNVFRETLVEMPEYLSENDTYINQFIKGGDSVYMLVYQYDNETRSQSYFIQPFDLVNGTFGERINIETEQTDTANTNLNTFTVGEDGTVYLMLETYSFTETSYEQSFELRTIKDGTSRSLDVDLLADEDEGGFYVNSMLAANDGTLILASWNGIRLITSDGKVKNVELDKDGNMEVQSLSMIDGTVYATVWYYGEDNYGPKIVEFDPETGTFGEELDVRSDHSYRMIMGPGYDYYYNDSTCVWGVDIKSGEMTEVINFINSDINGNDVNQVIPLSADRFFITRFDRMSGSTTKLAFLDRVPDEEVVEKKILTLAVSYVTYDLRNSVIEFNKSNDTYRITIDDYSRYNTDENYSAGIEKLNTDIIAGKVPDIFLVNSETPYDVYAAKGIFADLYELMDNDPSFDRSQYLGNIFKAYEYDGKLLTLVPSFQIDTFAAKAELIDGMEGWTMSEFMEFAKAHPDMSMFDYDFNRSRFIEMFMLFGRDIFINDETGECRFDTEEFRELLTFAATLSEENFWESAGNETNTESFWAEYDNRFVENRVLLSMVTLYNIDYGYKDILNYMLKAEPVFIGFPVSEGNGALITSNAEYAISSRCKFKEGAWEFLKTFISADAQMPEYNEQYKYWNYPMSGLPIYRPALDKMIEIAKTPREETEDFIIKDAVTMPAVSSGIIVSAETEAIIEYAASEETVTADSNTSVDNDVFIPVAPIAPDVPADSDSDGIMDDDIAIQPWVDPYAIPLTDAQIEQCLALIEGTTQVSRQDRDLNDIINEELEPFFAGKQSLDDTVDHIQNRVSIYIGETK